VLVLVGYRKAAIEAARQLGVPFVVVSNRDLGARPRANLFYCDFSAAALDACAEHIERRGVVRAIVPVTERAVVAAAHLRRILRIRGDSMITAQRCTDKWVMKGAFTACNIPCAPGILGVQGQDMLSHSALYGFPRVLKLRMSSGGRGMRVVREAGQWPEGVDDQWMIEPWIDGIETSVECLVQAGEILFCNRTRYLIPRWASSLPEVLGEDDVQALNAIILRVIQAVGVLDGMVHMELFNTENGWMVSEIAARPPGGHLMELMSLAYSTDMWQQVLRVHLHETLLPFSDATRVWGAMVLHPGAGVVGEMDGVADVRRMPGVVKCVVTAKSGDAITPRLGAGQEVGYIIANGNSHDEVRSRLVAARDRIYWDMQ
jgi:biotin carboxylase